MNDDKYNGWTNRETWLVWLWLGDAFTDMFQEEPGYAFDSDYVEQFTRDCIDQEALVPSFGLASDMLGGCLARVNWHEIAEAANDNG